MGALLLGCLLSYLFLHDNECQQYRILTVNECQQYRILTFQDIAELFV